MSNSLKLAKMDFLNLLSMKKTVGICLGLLVLFSFSPTTIVMSCSLLSYSTGLSVLSYDESYKSNYLYASLPVSRQQVVNGKYLFILSLVLFAFGAELLLSLLRPFFPFIPSIPFSETLFLLLSSVISACLFHAIILPIILYWGTSKIRLVMIVIFIVFMTISSLLGTFSQTADWTAAENILSTVVSLIPSAGLLISGALLLLSYWISSILYAKREFTE